LPECTGWTSKWFADEFVNNGLARLIIINSTP
jgi:hypothetical protein